MASRQHVLKLYKALITESKKFPAYNYRCYALRKIRDGFRNNKHLSDETQVLNEIAYAKNNLEIVKRQVIVGQLYSTEKLVIESPDAIKN